MAKREIPWFHNFFSQDAINIEIIPKFFFIRHKVKWNEIEKRKTVTSVTIGNSLVAFYATSTFLVYLMPNPVYTYILHIYDIQTHIVDNIYKHV